MQENLIWIWQTIISTLLGMNIHILLEKMFLILLFFHRCLLNDTHYKLYTIFQNLKSSEAQGMSVCKDHRRYSMPI